MLGRRSENYNSSAREAHSYENSSAHYFVPTKWYIKDKSSNKNVPYSFIVCLRINRESMHESPWNLMLRSFAKLRRNLTFRPKSDRGDDILHEELHAFLRA